MSEQELKIKETLDAVMLGYFKNVDLGARITAVSVEWQEVVASRDLATGMPARISVLPKIRVEFSQP